MIEIKEIKASEWLHEAEELMLEHWEEVAKDTGMPMPSIHKEGLEMLEDDGCMLSVGAFDNGVLIGYSVNMVARTFNFSEVIILQNEGLFLKKQYRAMLIGLKLIKETERLAKDRGATRAQWHTYRDSKADILFKSMKYCAYDVIYSKEL